jgi:hypothetical protein
VQADRRNVTRQMAIEVPDAYRRAPDSLPHADIATASFYDESLRRKVEAYLCPRSDPDGHSHTAVWSFFFHQMPGHACALTTRFAAKT